MSPIKIYCALPKSERRAYVDALANVLSAMAKREEEWQRAQDDLRGVTRSAWGAFVAWARGVV